MLQSYYYWTFLCGFSKGEEKFPSNNCDVEKLGTKSHAFPPLPLLLANIFLSVIGIEPMPLPFYFTNDRNFPRVIAPHRNRVYTKKPLSTFSYQERSVFRKKFIILLLLLLERYFFSCSIFEIFNHRCSYSIVGCY